jgi:hypothetical protein
VWVNSSTQELWGASWQDGDRISDSPDGPRDQVIAWARAVPAASRMVFSAEANDYLDLDALGDADSPGGGDAPPGPLHPDGGQA